jgi:hypothetical protein
MHIGYRTSLRIKSILLFAGFLFFAGKATSQNACPIGSAFVNNVCPTQSQFMGVSTPTGATYTWYKDGATIAGPLPGDGGSTSFGFEINSALNAGHYYVEKNQGGVFTCLQNVNVVFTPLPSSQTLNGSGPLCGGQKILSIAGSEVNVTYELLLDNSPTGKTINSVSTGAKNFPAVFAAGTYSVRAINNDCFGAYSYFGSVVVTNQPDRAIVDLTTTSSARVNWSGSGTYLIEYGAAGFTPGTGASAGAGGTVVSRSVPTYVITGLTTGASYDVYIRQLCSGSTYASSAVTNFVTNCADVTTFPFTQGFETVTTPALPACWKTYNNNNDSYRWQTSTFFPRTGTKHLELASNFDIPSHDDYLLLPPMTLTGNQRLKFWARASTTTQPQLYQVKISTNFNTITDFSTVLLTETLTSDVYAEKIINLTGYSGTVYLAIVVPPTAPAATRIYVDDVTVENIPACPGPSLVKFSSTTNNSAIINWIGTGTYILEYGLAGFTPGTGATAGAGGTVISGAVSPQTISGLTASTSYDVYVRQSCTGSTYSVNSPKVNFTTFFTCSPTIISTCSDVNVSSPAGNGVVDFGGFYPNNSSGTVTPGKELLYSFTPSTTGVYFVDVTALSTGLAYLYKPASSGCGNTGWTGIANIYAIGKYPIGLLQAGTEYYFLLDNPGGTARTQTFKICLATLTSPSTLNACITAVPSPYIPANSTKPEYIIDNAGNLIAALDFSGVSNAVGSVSLSYYVNNGTLRKDNASKEYLNRNFTITTTNAPANPVGVTLYFTNLNLTNLINDPDDGIADVSSINDLKITRDQAACSSGASGGTNITSYITQTGNGTYDGNTKYVQFNTTSLSSFYIHGGTDGLFNTAILCPGSDATLNMTPPGTGYIYQWQVDAGSGFVNISNNDYYSGVNTSTLLITAPPTSYYGYRYRCTASNFITPVNTDARIIKFSTTWDGSENTNWEHPDNWGCSSSGKAMLPDANTDIIIQSGPVNMPVINSNVICRSITVKSGATLQVASGYRLTVVH